MTNGAKKRGPGWWKLPNGKYRAVYRDPQGRQHFKTFQTMTAAKQWKQDHEVKVREGAYIDPKKGRIRLDEYWPHFLEGLEGSEGRAPALSTVDRYRRHFHLYIGTDAARQAVETDATLTRRLPAEERLGSMRLSDITPERVRRWRNSLRTHGAGEATINAVTQLLKAIFNRAVDSELIARSPARGIKNPAIVPDGGMRALEPEQVRALSNAHAERFRALVLLLGWRGLRIGEAAALQVRDFDPMRATITIDESRSDRFGVSRTKTGKVRTLGLPAFLRDALTEHLARFSEPTDPDAYVFTMPEGGPLAIGNYRRRIFSRAVVAAGLDPELTPHDLRDTAATLAFKAGATVREVQLMLGHADPAITLRRYTGVLDSMKAATEAALDRMFLEAAAPSAADVVRMPRAGA